MGVAAQELVAMDLQNGPGTRMSALIDAAGVKMGGKEFQGAFEGALSKVPSEARFERCSSG